MRIDLMPINDLSKRNALLGAFRPLLLLADAEVFGAAACGSHDRAAVAQGPALAVPVTVNVVAASPVDEGGRLVVGRDTHFGPQARGVARGEFDGVAANGREDFPRNRIPLTQKN